jgi:hypothetical protein
LEIAVVRARRARDEREKQSYYSDFASPVSVTCAANKAVMPVLFGI